MYTSASTVSHYFRLYGMMHQSLSSTVEYLIYNMVGIHHMCCLYLCNAYDLFERWYGSQRISSNTAQAFSKELNMKTGVAFVTNLIFSAAAIAANDHCHTACANVKKVATVKSACNAFRNALPRPKVCCPLLPGRHAPKRPAEAQNERDRSIEHERKSYWPCGVHAMFRRGTNFLWIYRSALCLLHRHLLQVARHCHQGFNAAIEENCYEACVNDGNIPTFVVEQRLDNTCEHSLKDTPRPLCHDSCVQGYRAGVEGVSSSLTKMMAQVKHRNSVMWRSKIFASWRTRPQIHSWKNCWSFAIVHYDVLHP